MNWRFAARLNAAMHAPGEGTRPTVPWLGFSERGLSSLVRRRGGGWPQKTKRTQKGGREPALARFVAGVAAFLRLLVLFEATSVSVLPRLARERLTRRSRHGSRGGAETRSGIAAKNEKNSKKGEENRRSPGSLPALPPFGVSLYFLRQHPFRSSRAWPGNASHAEAGMAPASSQARSALRFVLLVALTPWRLCGFAALLPLPWAVKGQGKEKPPSRQAAKKAPTSSVPTSAISAAPREAPLPPPSWL
jgi:hypothetical protein